MAQSLKNMLGSGMGVHTALLINGTTIDGLTATGSVQSDAFQLTSDVNVVTTVPAGTGVRLAPIPLPGDETVVVNLGANGLNVYPGIGGSVQGATVNAPYVLSAGASSSFLARPGSQNWIVLSSGGTAPPVAPTLGALTFSSTTYTTGAATSGTINGATVGSTITASSLPTGLTINGAARTWAWDGTGTASTGSFTLTETLAGATNTPHNSTISYTISAASGSLSISTAPTLSGDPVVGQRVYRTNGTYNATPDSFTESWTVGGTAVDHDTDNLLVLDSFAGSAIGYSEVAHKASYTDAPTNAATSTASVTTIDNGGTAGSIPGAITAFTRTSASGVTPMTWSVTFGANVYAGYVLHATVYSDAGLTTQTQSVFHTLTNDDLQPGATINLAGDGLTTIGATQYLQLTVQTTSPNSVGYLYTYPTALSPTDAAGHRYWKFTVTAGSYSVLRSIQAATTTSGADAAGGRTYTYTPTNCEQTTGSNLSAYWFDGNDSTAGSFDTNTVALPNAVTIDFGTKVDLHELRLKQYSANPSPPTAFSFASSDDNVTFTNAFTPPSGLTWTADEVKTWDW